MPSEKPKLALTLLRFDASAGGVVGIGVLCLRGSLAELYGLPSSLVMFLGAANLAYAAYSGTLAWSASRGAFPSRLAIDALIAANFAWALICAVLLVATWSFASALGSAMLGLECVFLAVLAEIERRRVRPFASVAIAP